MIRFLWQTFLKGLVVVVPIMVAIYVFLWLFLSLESFMKKVLVTFMPERFYIPGIGFVAAIVLVFGIGLLMYSWITRRLLESADQLFRRIPLFASIYCPTRDLMDMVGGEFRKQLGAAVMIEIPGTGIETLGFITQEDIAEMPDGLRKENHVVVFVQWSSQIGGYCFVVPREKVRPVDMSVEEALRWSLTAGISAPRGRAHGRPTESSHGHGTEKEGTEKEGALEGGRSATA